ncbi:MAG: DNA/RNA non-specific endonuclease [Bacteriovoracia bacterium]
MRPIIFLISLFLSFSTYSTEEIIQRKNYTLSYNEDHEVANWVAYELDHEKLQNCVKRRNNFRIDPDISTGSAAPEDYKNSGYDRGHLVPAGDMKHTREAMNDTFYYSNMSPQPPRFNQGIWARLEHLMRSWGIKYKSILLITGPVLKDNLPSIGVRNDVSVPEEYFKLILRKQGQSWEGIAFIMKTDVTSTDLRSYVTSIDTVERKTGIDFFKDLPDEVEEDVESKFNIKNWDFSGRFEYLPCRTSVTQQRKWY